MVPPGRLCIAAPTSRLPADGTPICCAGLAPAHCPGGPQPARCAGREALAASCGQTRAHPGVPCARGRLSRRTEIRPVRFGRKAMGWRNTLAAALVLLLLPPALPGTDAHAMM